MNRVAQLGIDILTEVMLRLGSMTPDRFKAPQMPRRTHIYALGEATPYQKALLTLMYEIDSQHVELHEENDLRFGGHINLPPEHEFLHAAPDILSTMLSVNLSNTFKELSADVDYYICPKWQVYVVKKPIRFRPRKAREKIPN